MQTTSTYSGVNELKNRDNYIPHLILKSQNIIFERHINASRAHQNSKKFWWALGRELGSPNRFSGNRINKQVIRYIINVSVPVYCEKQPPKIAFLDRFKDRQAILKKTNVGHWAKIASRPCRRHMSFTKCITVSKCQIYIKYVILTLKINF